MKRLGEISLGHFMRLVPRESDRKRKETIDLGDKQVHMRIATPRLVTLRLNNNCVVCGVKGTVVYVEENAMGPHMNMYTADGVLMTANYIKPKRLGGSEEPYNRRTVCQTCLVARQQEDERC